MTDFYQYVLALVQLFAMFTLAVLLGRIVERKWPVAATLPDGEYAADIKLSSLTIVLNWLVGPVTGACAAWIVGLAGGGLIALRADGWWFPISLLTLILTLDFIAYWMHRAQHAVPALWAMHSLHHSAEAMTIVTGARHFWFENAAQTALLPFMVVLFKIPPVFLVVIPLIYFLPDGCAHLNVRLPLGRFALWFNNPQYHRIHHSVLPEHRDKNFCKMLPLFDLIFGTAWAPAPDEFPATGLTPSEKPNSLMDGIIWPIRNLVPILRILDSRILSDYFMVISTYRRRNEKVIPVSWVEGSGHRDACQPMEPVREQGIQQL
jgi:sterol desaturase/sphingolipid hydroxylase (fatty acid hydroxylase superfamily)